MISTRIEFDEDKFPNERKIVMNWKVKEEDIKNMENGFLESKKVASNIPGVKYSLRLCPNGSQESERNAVRAYLLLDFGMSKQINASYTISVKTASKYLTFRNVFFKSSASWGNTLGTREEVFDAEKKFFTDGIMELELEGTLKSQGIKRKATIVVPHYLGELLLDSDEDKDVTIVVGEKEIKVHKFILTACSSVFKAELNNPGFKESNEKKIVVTDFCYETVENAVMYCYERPIHKYVDFDETASQLLHFADKYDMAILHEYLQTKLIQKMSGDNVVEYANASLTSNSLDLREFCICFLINAAKHGKVITNMEKLQDEIAMEYGRRSLLSITK